MAFTNNRNRGAGQRGLSYARGDYLADLAFLSSDTQSDIRRQWMATAKKKVAAAKAADGAQMELPAPHRWHEQWSATLDGQPYPLMPAWRRDICQAYGHTGQVIHTIFTGPADSVSAKVRTVVTAHVNVFPIPTYCGGASMNSFGARAYVATANPDSDVIDFPSGSVPMAKVEDFIPNWREVVDGQKWGNLPREIRDRIGIAIGTKTEALVKIALMSVWVRLLGSNACSKRHLMNYWDRTWGATATNAEWCLKNMPRCGVDQDMHYVRQLCTQSSLYSPYMAPVFHKVDRKNAQESFQLDTFDSAVPRLNYNSRNTVVPYTVYCGPALSASSNLSVKMGQEKQWDTMFNGPILYHGAGLAEFYSPG